MSEVFFRFSFVAVAGKDMAKDITGVLATWADQNFVLADSKREGKILKEDLGSALFGSKILFVMDKLWMNCFKILFFW